MLRLILVPVYWMTDETFLPDLNRITYNFISIKTKSLNKKRVKLEKRISTCLDFPSTVM